jgi:hypothetical protein
MSLRLGWRPANDAITLVKPARSQYELATPLIAMRLYDFSKTFLPATLLAALVLLGAPALAQTNVPSAMAASSAQDAVKPGEQSRAEAVKQRWILGTLIVVLLAVGAAHQARARRNLNEG